MREVCCVCFKELTVQERRIYGGRCKDCWGEQAGNTYYQSWEGNTGEVSNQNPRHDKNEGQRGGKRPS